MSGLVLPGQPRTIDMNAWDALNPAERLDALHAGFHDLHRRLRKAEAENKALAAQVNVVFELWAVVSTLVDVGPGRGKHGRRHFLARVEEAKRAINKVAAGGPRGESRAHQLLDAIKAMNEREAKAMADALKAAAEKAKEAKQAADDALVEQVGRETREAIRAAMPEPGVLLAAALVARADQQEAGGEPLTRVRVDFQPNDAHRLALASEGFVLEGPGEESVGSVLLRVGASS